MNQSRLRSGAAVADRAGFVSISQERRLWFEHWLRLMSRDVVPFHTSLALHLSGPLDVEAVRDALAAIVRRHEVFRVAFHLSASRAEAARSKRAKTSFTAFVTPNGELHLRTMDLSDMDERAATCRLEQSCSDDVSRPFDYAVAPLARATLFRMGAEEHVLLFVIHHLISDGWSLRILRREFEGLYAKRIGSGGTLPSTTAQYGDFAAWQRERLRGRVLDDHMAYWLGRYQQWEQLLVNVRQLPLPLCASGERRKEPKTTDLILDESRTRKVNACAGRHRATPYVVFLTALQAVLRAYTDRPVVGLMVHFANRTRPSFENVIGWCATRHIFTCETTPRASGALAVAQIRDGLRDAIVHQEIPSCLLWREVIAQAADRERRPAKPDMGSYITFDLQGDSESHVRELRINRIESHPQTIRSSLAMRVLDGGGRVTLRAKYAGNQFAEADIRRLVCDWHDVVSKLVDSPNEVLM